MPTPIMAIPAVPTVPQEEPRISDTAEHSSMVTSRKMLGLITFRPNTSTVEIVPAASQVPIMMPE